MINTRKPSQKDPYEAKTKRQIFVQELKYVTLKFKTLVVGCKRLTNYVFELITQARYQS